MEMPRYCENDYMRNLPMDGETNIHSTHRESDKCDPACENAMGEIALGGSFKKMRLVGSPLKGEHFDIAHFAARQTEKRKNEHLKEANNEIRRDLAYNQSDHVPKSPQYYQYCSGLETPHEKEGTNTLKDMHQTLLFSNQGTLSGKLPQKDQSGGRPNCPMGTTNKYEASYQMNPMENMSKKCLIDNCPKDEASDFEKSTEYNSAQNILSSFENGVYVDSEQTLPMEGTNSDAYITKGALNSMSTISYNHYDNPTKREDPGLVHSGTHIFSDKREPLAHDKEKLLMFQLKGNNTHLSNASSMRCTRSQNAASIGGHTIWQQQPRDEKTTYYNYKVKGEAEMCDAWKGYENYGPYVTSANIKTDSQKHHPVNSSLADCPNGDLLCVNEATMGSANINKGSQHVLNNSVLSNGYMVHDEDPQKMVSISNNIMTSNSAWKEHEAQNGAFIQIGAYTPMDHIKKIKEVQPKGFISPNYTTCAMTRSNLCEHPADLISDNTYYYNNHVNGMFLNGGPDAYGVRQSKGCFLHVDRSWDADTHPCKNGSSHEMGTPRVFTVPIEHSTSQRAAFNGQDEQNISPTRSTQKMNHTRGIFESSPEHTSGKNYLSTFVQNDYEVDEIKSCIPERPLYGNQNYDVPKIIQGITTKQNNGIVSECNQDTIIEYNNKWRLVKGKQFAINQVDNFKSVEDSATYFQSYLTEQNENTKRMLSRINFNSLTGKFSINSLGDDDGHNVRQLSKVYDYKDTLRSYPAYYGISQHMHCSTKEALKCEENKGRAISPNDNPSDCTNVHEQMRKKKSVGKKPNLALCGAGGGDYQLKNRIQAFVSQKMSDYFNVNFV
ncbi:hypothetical protein AK88_01882 [Plasmodium fragile]|uniref:Uncharacterized protein n=1 Tax=Plasmodium fragile TaxID=5857 RepID=A0A0D9QMV9_PLAFR|nr:uncharacterized protein AK88_01882 [Plasmodium fragile]KJP88430.1 hypothetical protein AK88_01882 [Plasmodium fragile]